MATGGRKGDRGKEGVRNLSREKGKEAAKDGRDVDTRRVVAGRGHRWLRRGTQRGRI
jgi:hypothetical protein